VSDSTRKVQWQLMLKYELTRRFAPVRGVSFVRPLRAARLYNPLGLDALKAHAFACARRSAAGGVVAPASYWHIHEDNWRSRDWIRCVRARPMYLTSMPTELFFDMYLYQLRACVNAGFRSVIPLPAITAAWRSG